MQKGKPIADIYIDDRAINPYINNISYFGLFYKNNDFIPNKINNNKFNVIEKYDNYIVKKGPSFFMKGELFYYQNIPLEYETYFAKLIGFTYLQNEDVQSEYIPSINSTIRSKLELGIMNDNMCNKNDELIEIKIDFIRGIPLYYIYKNKLLTFRIIDELINILNKFHSTKNINININEENIKNNYFKKLQKRFNKKDYFFEDSEYVFNEILNGLEKNYAAEIVQMIHGDFWFSNILLTYDDNYKCIDMKGQIDDILTINGDKYYDYGKLYQSILGYDLILNSDLIDYEYITKMKIYFLQKCKENGLNLSYLKFVTKSLVFGTLYFIQDNKDIKENIWKFIQSDLMNNI